MNQDMIETDFYTEGPVVDGHGVIYVTTLLGKQILKIDDQRQPTVWASSSCPNGQIIAANGHRFVCNSTTGTIEKFDEQGRHLGVFFQGTVEGYVVSCPNDIWVGEQGLFFTDSVRHSGAVIFLDHQGQGRVIAQNLDYPNGIVYDERLNCLYVAESFKNRILKIDLSLQDNPVSTLLDLPKHPSGEESKNLPDGLFLEHNEQLWIAHYGMGQYHCFQLQQKLLTSFDSQITLTSNIYVNDEIIVLTGGEGEPGPGRIRIINRR